MRVIQFQAVASLSLALLLAAAPAGARAALSYQNINGTGVIYDSVSGVYWTQAANVSGTTFDWQDAQTWAAGLTIGGIASPNWQLPSPDQFTSLYGQLEGSGDKYGLQVLFGSGPNDYASDVQPEYWTDTTGTDFNFFYGYPGTQPNSNLYPVWAVTSVPEPTPFALGLIMAGGFFSRRWLGRSLRGSAGQPFLTRPSSR
jgi:hypothetical protein